jgi:type I restriction enzyme S subunit
MKYQTYPNYKPSGVEWLGDVPENWGIWKLNHFAPIITCGVAATPEYIDDGVMFLSAQNVKNRTVDLSKGFKYISRAKHNELTKNREPKNGDILLSRVGTVGEVCIIDVDFEFSIFVSLTHLRLNQNICLNKFFVFLCESKYVKSLNNSVTLVGGGVGNLNVNDLREYRFPLPPLPEQQKIANFLDHETAKIDTLIDKQQRLIALLKEKRQAVISHAVTKGLNPNAPMKPSGVEWLGDVPVGWGVSSLGYYAQISTGATPDRTNENYWGGDIPWIKTGEVRYDEIFETEEYITAEAVANSSTKISPVGTLLMAMYGQGITRGRVALLGVSATYNQACAAITPNEKIWNNYLRYFFMAAYHAIRDGGNETSQMNLNADIVSKFKIVIPDLEAQYQIVDYLNEKLKGFDVLLSKAESAIELIQERRTALISAAVTGKIDVRDWGD